LWQECGMPATYIQMLSAAQLTNITPFNQMPNYLQCHICSYLAVLRYFELFTSNWNHKFTNMWQWLDSRSHAALKYMWYCSYINNQDFLGIVYQPIQKEHCQYCAHLFSTILFSILLYTIIFICYTFPYILYHSVCQPGELSIIKIRHVVNNIWAHLIVYCISSTSSHNNLRGETISLTI